MICHVDAGSVLIELDLGISQYVDLERTVLLKRPGVKTHLLCIKPAVRDVRTMIAVLVIAAPAPQRRQIYAKRNTPQFQTGMLATCSVEKKAVPQSLES